MSLKRVFEFSILLPILMFTSQSLFSQGSLEHSISNIAKDLSSGIVSKMGKKRVAVIYVLDQQNNRTELGSYLAESFNVERLCCINIAKR